METHFCGPRVFGMQRKPSQRPHFGTFWPIYCRAKNMQKPQFDAILTAKLHGTATCRHAENGVARARSVCHAQAR